MPFGEEIGTGVGGRGSDYAGSGAYPAPADTVTDRKFTGKERDAETGLDYFGARYFSGAQGRFTSPDWSATPQAIPYADLTDPQTLNLYSYVRNNPLRRADPDGHCGLIGGDTPCSFSQFVSSLPDRLVGGLKGESNVIFGTHFQASNGEQAEVMGNVQEAAPVLTTGLAMVLPGPKSEAGELVGGEIDVPSAPTMRAAQREGMREGGIPTSQQPASQESTPAGRQYTYEVPNSGGGTQTKIVQRNVGTDSSHPGQPHVEVGSPKSAGQTDSIGRPRLDSNKVKVNVKKPNEQ
jgi:RHS repeat-associated protein